MHNFTAAPAICVLYSSCETPEFQQKRITFRNAMAMTSSKDIVQLVVSRDHILEVNRHHVCPLLRGSILVVVFTVSLQLNDF